MNTPTQAKYDDPYSQYDNTNQSVRERLGNFRDKYADSYVDDLIDSAQAGVSEATANIATGARNLLTDNQNRWQGEADLYHLAGSNRNEINPTRRAEMEQWGFDPADRITAGGTGLQIAQALGTSIPMLAAAIPATVATATVGASAPVSAGVTALAAGLVNAGLVGGSSAKEVEQKLSRMSQGELDTLIKSENAKPDTYSQYDSPEAFKYAQQQSASKQGALLGGISGAIAAPILGKVAAGLGSQTAMRRIATGAATEGLQEFGEEVGQAVIANRLTGRPTLENAVMRGIEGAVLGAGAGGSTGVVGAGVHSAITHLLPESGAISRAVNAGAVSNAQAQTETLPTVNPEASNESGTPIIFQSNALGSRPDALTPQAAAIMQEHGITSPLDSILTQTEQEFIGTNIPANQLSDMLTGTKNNFHKAIVDSASGNIDTANQHPAYLQGIGLMSDTQPAPVPNSTTVPPLATTDSTQTQRTEVSPEAQSVTDSLLKQNKAVDTILQNRSLNNPLSRIVATKIEALQQDDLEPAEHLDMLASMIDNFNHGVLAAESNSIDNNLYRDDAYYQMGAALVGRDNVNRNEVDNFNGQTQSGALPDTQLHSRAQDLEPQPETPQFAKYDTAPVQHQLDYNPNLQNQTRHIPTHTFQSPVNTVRSGRDAAAVMKAAIGNMAQENMTAVVTDNDGNILNIAKHALGAKDSASVHAGDLVGSIVNTPQATKVWLSHNHPSGKVGASNADTKITGRIEDLLVGTGVKLADHVIVGSNLDRYYSLLDDNEYAIDGSDVGIEPNTSTETYPLSLTERMYTKTVNPETQFHVTSPDTAREAADNMPEDSGIILMDNRHGIIGTLPLASEEMAKLKANNGEALRKVYSAIDTSNSSAIIIKGNDVEAARNLSKFLNAHDDVRILDYLTTSSNQGIATQSDAEQGGAIIGSTGVFHSRNTDRGSQNTSQSTNDLQREIGKLKNVIIEQSNKSDTTVSGKYNPYTGTITLYSNAIAKGQGKQTLIHEFTHKLMTDKADVYKAALQELDKPSIKRSKQYKAAAKAVDAAGTPEAQRQHELLAYYIQNHPSSGLVTRMLNKIRKFIREHFGLKRVTLSEVRDAVEASIETARTTGTENMSVHEGTGTGTASASASTESASIMGGTETDDNNSTPGFIERKLNDWSNVTLSTLNLRHLEDIGKRYVPQITDYVKLNNLMQTERNKHAQQADDIAERWRQFNKNNKVEALKLAKVMHTSTLIKFDPSLGTATNAKETGLQLEFNRLSEDAKHIYQAIRESYKRQRQIMNDALQERIERSILNNQQKQALKDEIRQQFELANSQEPHFPLRRWGEYWLAGNEPESTGSTKSERIFSMFETHKELLIAQKRLTAAGYSNIITGKQLEQAKLSDSNDELMLDFMQVLDRYGISRDSALVDELYQSYLKTLPDISSRTNFLHREGIKGYSEDALRAYASTSFHNAAQVARLKYAGQMQQTIDKGREDINKSSDPIKAANILNELNKRHDWIMAPKSSVVAQKLSAAGFAYYLSTSPAAGLVNLSQNGLLTIPVLGAKFGNIKAFTKMNQVLAEFALVGGNFNPTLSSDGTRAIKTPLKGDRARAFKAMQNSGAIDVTQAHNLAGLGDMDSMNEYSPRMHSFMRKISWIFHSSEVLNRSVTGMASYDLAKQSGMTHRQAIDYAESVIWDSHYDYSSAARPRFMQNDFTKIALMFRQYSINTSYYLLRNFYQSFKGDDKQTRQEAMKKLTSTLSMSLVMSGIMGLPLVSVVSSMANAFADLAGESDEPYDFEIEFRKKLKEWFGDSAGAIAQDGLVNLSGLDWASRTQLNDLFFRSSNHELAGRDLFHEYLSQLAGPVGGMALNGFRGAELLAQGYTQRGFETMLPKGLRDPLKAYRYNQDGVATLKGDPLIKDTSAWQEVVQALGFTPADVKDQYIRNNALKKYESHILDRRAQLLTTFAVAHANKDTKGKVGTLKDMRAFSKRYPALKINGQTIRRSIRSRRRYSVNSDGGMYLNRKVSPYIKKRLDWNQYDD